MWISVCWKLNSFGVAQQGSVFLVGRNTLPEANKSHLERWKIPKGKAVVFQPSKKSGASCYFHGGWKYLLRNHFKKTGFCKKKNAAFSCCVNEQMARFSEVTDPQLLTFPTRWWSYLKSHTGVTDVGRRQRCAIHRILHLSLRPETEATSGSGDHGWRFV